MAMYCFAELCRRTQISLARRAYLPSIRQLANSGPLHDRERLTHVEAEFRVQGKGAVVKRRLDQPYAGERTLIRAINDGSHQLASYRPILYAGSDGNRSDARNCGTLIQAIAPDNLSI